MHAAIYDLEAEGFVSTLGLGSIKPDVGLRLEP